MSEEVLLSEERFSAKVAYIHHQKYVIARNLHSIVLAGVHFTNKHR